MKNQLKLGFTEVWRTSEEKKFLKSKEWDDLREIVKKKHDHTCSYCGRRIEKGLMVHHINGKPSDHRLDNLTPMCGLCNMIEHSGFSATVLHRLRIFENRKKLDQAQVIRTIADMRDAGASDEEILAKIGLKEKDERPWKQDLKYLSKHIGFVTAKPIADEVKYYA